MDEVLLAGVSAVIGSVVTLAWETILKPRRERHALATALAGELANNARTIEHGLGQAEPDLPELVRVLSDTVFAASVHRLGELAFADTLRVTEIFASIRNLKQREWMGSRRHPSEEGEIVPVEAQRIQASRELLRDYEMRID